MVDHLHNPIPHIVHSSYPQHLILGLELFCNALTGVHPHYQLKEHSLHLFVQIRQIPVQLASNL